MFTVIVQSLNQYSEVELEKSFRAKTKAAASMMAAKWCNAGWGDDWKEVVSKCDIGDDMFIWALRWK